MDRSARMSEFVEESLSTFDPGPKDRLRESLDQVSISVAVTAPAHASRLKVLAAFDEVALRRLAAIHGRYLRMSSVPSWCDTVALG
jgi:hypothetical protein